MRGSPSGIVLGPLFDAQPLRYDYSQDLFYASISQHPLWSLAAKDRRTDGQTDLFDPPDQLALAGILKGSHGDSELLAPREPFLDLDIWWVPRVDVLCLLRFVVGFPARVPLPSIPILREERLHTWKIQMESPIV